MPYLVAHMHLFFSRAPRVVVLFVVNTVGTFLFVVRCALVRMRVIYYLFCNYQ